MLKNMDYFYEIYKMKSFSRAADNLFISQSSLSITIKKAEERIGAAVFDRNTTPICLTPFGEKYIEAIEEIKGITHRLENYIGGKDQALIGKVDVAASYFCTSYLLSPVLAEFHRLYPLVDLNVHEYGGSNFRARLADGTYDMIISSYQPRDEHSRSWPLYHENFSLAIPLCFTDTIEAIEHLPKGQSPLNVCRNLPFIMLRKGNSSRELADQLLQKFEFAPNIILELNQQATACSMAAAGLGAVICSQLVIDHVCGENVKVFPLLDNDAWHMIYISVRRQDIMTSPMIKFIEVAQKILNNL